MNSRIISKANEKTESIKMYFFASDEINGIKAKISFIFNLKTHEIVEILQKSISLRETRKRELELIMKEIIENNIDIIENTANKLLENLKKFWNSLFENDEVNVNRNNGFSKSKNNSTITNDEFWRNFMDNSNTHENKDRILKNTTM